MLNFEENSWLPPDLGDKLDYIASVVTTGDEQYVKKQTFFTNFWGIRRNYVLPETFLERSDYLTSNEALAKL